MGVRIPKSIGRYAKIELIPALNFTRTSFSLIEYKFFLFGNK